MIIEPSSDIGNKLIKHLNEDGYFKFIGLFENFSKYHEYDENDIRMIFLKIDGQTYICKSKSKSLSVIKSDNIVTVSLNIIRLKKTMVIKKTPIDWLVLDLIQFMEER